MKARAKISDDEVARMSLELTFSAPVGEWRELMRQQGTQWPSWQMGRLIADALGHISRATDSTFELD